MASPIAHSFAGFWTFLFFAKQLQVRLSAQWRQYLLHLGVLVLLANLPDFDFPISLALFGNASLHHEFFSSGRARGAGCKLRVADRTGFLVKCDDLLRGIRLTSFD
jgi:hypothetical protein